MWSPPGISPRTLESVHLYLHFAEPVRANEGQDTPLATAPNSPQQEKVEPQSSVVGELVPEDEPRVLPIQSSKTRHSTRKQLPLNDAVYPKQKAPGRSPLDEASLFALIDAGFRNAICLRPIRTAPGVKCLAEQGMLRLCDLAPAVFVPHHAEQFEEQAKLIPAVSTVLAKFLEYSTLDGANPQAEGTFSQYSEGSHKVQHTINELQKDIWLITANGGQNHDAARRLHPLWSPKTVKGHHPTLDTRNTAQSETASRSKDACEDFELWSRELSGSKGICHEDLFDFCLDFNSQANISSRYLPTVTLKDVNGHGNVTAEDVCDVGIEGAWQEPDDVSDELLEIDLPTAAPAENSSCANSLPRMSDVSMLEEPVEESGIIRQTNVIRGSMRLTQNVIRMQQEHELYVADERDHSGRRHRLDQRHRLGWSEEENVSGAERPEESSIQHSNHQPADFGSSSVFLSSEKDLILDSEHIEQNRSPKTPITERTSPMSIEQSDHPSDLSLVDVLGNDQLLWHMWKRRASVTPLDEEEEAIHGMRTMFETDPDMKSLCRRWDQDPSDISSGSNDDHMLQDTVHQGSPSRDKAMTPNTARRSYFASTPSSSSSSCVGQSSSDFKRRGSLLKRLAWGGRHHTPEQTGVEVPKLDGRTMEVKRRKTLDDYEMMDREASNDDSNDMLF